MDILIARVMSTPPALGSAFVRGTAHLAVVRITAGPELGYSAVHVLAS